MIKMLGRMSAFLSSCCNCKVLIVLLVWTTCMMHCFVIAWHHPNTMASKGILSHHCRLQQSSDYIKSPKTLTVCRFASRGDDLDDLRIDVDKLDPEEQKRLDFITKLTKEADDYARAAGFNVDSGNDEEREKFEKSVEDTNWSGQSVAFKSRISTGNTLDLINRPALAIGDLLAFVVFASIGRGNHGENLDWLSIMNTAWPFLLSWIVLSPFLGAYSNSATQSKGAQVAIGMIPAWFCSVASALVIRGYVKDYIPPTPFIIVSMTATFVLLFLWRNLYVLAFGETTDGEYRKAGFLEIFSMITALIKRW